MNDRSPWGAKKAESTPNADACRVAASLIHHDIGILPLFLAVLALPAAIEAYTPQLSESGYLGLILLDRIVQIAVMFVVTVRVRRRLEQAHARRAGSLIKSFWRTAVFGLALWGMCLLPLPIAIFSSQSSLMLPAIFMIVVGAAWSLRYYFYCLPTGLLGFSLKKSALLAYSMGKKAPRAAIASIAAPLGIMLLLVSLCGVPYPDGRSLGMSAMASACEGVFWLLATYTTLGFGLGLIDDHEWREAGLDPYRAERIDTMRVQGGGFVSKALSPRFGGQALLLAALVFLGNQVRGAQQRPAAAIIVKSVAVEGEVLKIAVEVSDPKFHLRGFFPEFFTVKTETGAPISKELLSVSRDPSGQADSPALLLSAEPVTLYFQFRTAKTPEVLKSLDNMWLWYKLAPLEALPAPESVAPPQGSAMPTA